jgi:hypothetical protein
MGVFQKRKNWYIDYYLKGRRKRKQIGPSRKLAEQVLKDVLIKIIKKEYLGVLKEKKILFEDYAQQYWNTLRSINPFRLMTGVIILVWIISNLLLKEGISLRSHPI